MVLIRVLIFFTMLHSNNTCRIRTTLHVHCLLDTRWMAAGLGDSVQDRLVGALIRARHIVRRVQLEETGRLQGHHELLDRHDREICSTVGQ
jgi:hypothetical protein